MNRPTIPRLTIFRIIPSLTMIRSSSHRLRQLPLQLLKAQSLLLEVHFLLLQKRRFRLLKVQNLLPQVDYLLQRNLPLPQRGKPPPPRGRKPRLQRSREQRLPCGRKRLLPPSRKRPLPPRRKSRPKQSLRPPLLLQEARPEVPLLSPEPPLPRSPQLQPDAQR